MFKKITLSKNETANTIVEKTLMNICMIFSSRLKILIMKVENRNFANKIFTAAFIGFFI